MVRPPTDAEKPAKAAGVGVTATTFIRIVFGVRSNGLPAPLSSTWKVNVSVPTADGAV